MTIHRAVEAVAANRDGTLTAFTSPCGMCGKPGEVIVPADGFTAWATGQIAVQDAMPDLPRELREQLQTGIDPKCWKKYFSAPGDNGEDEARTAAAAPPPAGGRVRPARAVLREVTAQPAVPAPAACHGGARRAAPNMTLGAGGARAPG